uniref:Ig-like domain-containing protein n=1 Tax=Labrus bergylta TaxID=56723 RepID=A0A3Q3E7Z6_9LABR
RHHPLLSVLHYTRGDQIRFHCEIITVSKVSVKARGSISIPCLYEPPYRNHVKYLCRGHSWLLCSNEVKTNQTEATWKYSISDDTSQRIFTVTINDLEDYTDDTCYWCAVQLKRKKDDGKRFQLSITKGNLYVDHQKITAFERGSVTVMCRYKYLKVTEWCRLGSTCVTEQTGSIGGTTVTINETVPNVYNVTMSGLTTACSGWYWCTNGDFQIPVHIMVHKLASTTTEKITVNTKTASMKQNQLSSCYNNEAIYSDTPKVRQITVKMVSNCGIMCYIKMIVKFQIHPSQGSDTASDPDLLYSTICHNKRKAAHMKVKQ